MAIAKDASTPSFSSTQGGTNLSTLQTGTSSPFTQTSASFSPPSGSLVVMCVLASYENSHSTFASLGVTVADSASNSYVTGVAQASSNTTTLAGAGIFTFYYASAPGSITVSATLGTAEESGSGYALDIYPLVLTGCASAQTSPATASTASAGASAVQDISITPTTTGSWVIVADCAGVGSYTAASGTTTLVSGTLDAGSNTYAFGAAESVTGGSQITVGWTNATSWEGAIAALEVLPAGASGPSAPMPPATIAMPGPAWRSRWRPRGRQLQFPLAQPSTRSDSDSSNPAADGGELITVTPAVVLGPSDPGLAVPGLAVPGQPLVTSPETSRGADGGELVSLMATPTTVVAPSLSPSWRARFRHKSRPVVSTGSGVPPPVAVSDTDSSSSLDLVATAVWNGEVPVPETVHGTDGGENISFPQPPYPGLATASVSPVWRSKFRPRQPRVEVPQVQATMQVTVAISAAGFTPGLALQVYVLSGVDAFGGASDAEFNPGGAGTLTPTVSGSFVVWATSDIGDPVSAMVPAASNVLDTYVPGTPAWVGGAGHYTGAVTGGTVLTYGVTDTNPVNDDYVMCAYELRASGTPNLLYETGVTDLTGLTSLTSPPFAAAPGSVIVVAFAANNGTAPTAGVTITDSIGLNWGQKAVQDTPDGNYLASIWTASVPTLAAYSADFSGTGADSQVSIALADTDASGPEADAGESIAATGITDSETCHGRDSGEVIMPVGADASGAGLDAGESIAATGTASSDSSGAGADGGESVTAAVPGTDASGAGADGSEATVRRDFVLGQVLVAPSWRSRFRHLARPQMRSTGTIIVISVADTEACRGEDAEIDAESAADASTSLDAGEMLTMTDTDSSTSLESQVDSFDNDFSGQAFDFEQLVSALQISADLSLAFDQEFDQFTITDTDASGPETDGGESVNVHGVISADAGHGTDAGEAVTASFTTADASGAGLDGGEFIPVSADASNPAADAGYVLSGTFTDTDSSTAFDQASGRLGPDATPSDTDASNAAVDGGELIDVFAYQPLFRWTGGYFQLRPEGDS